VKGDLLHQSLLCLLPILGRQFEVPFEVASVSFMYGLRAPTIDDVTSDGRMGFFIPSRCWWQQAWGVHKLLVLKVNLVVPDQNKCQMKLGTCLETAKCLKLETIRRLIGQSYFPAIPLLVSRFLCLGWCLAL
jgi:hypothetical protein